MLSRKNRITRNEFPSFKRQGIRVFSGYFSGTLYESPSLEITKFSVVVSKKVSKSAVTRNTLRRRFYEIARTHLQRLEPGTMVVLYPKQEAIKAPFAVLQEEFEKTLGKTKLFH